MASAFDLGGVVAEAVKLLRATTPSRIEIRSTVEFDLPPAMGDSTQVQQILMNLGVNAVHAMNGQGGLLEMRADAFTIAEGAGARHLDLSPGKYARISVRDTGSGIPEQNLQRIFDPFFTTKAAGAGTGLGLSVVHGIVKAHKGSITVESVMTSR